MDELTGLALSAVEQALDSLAGASRSVLPADARLTLVRRARVLASRLAALVAVLLAEADAAGSSLVATGTPTTSWLSLDGASTSREAAGELFAAADVSRYPIVADAALSGRLGVRHARAVAKGVDALPACLDEAQGEKAQRLLVERAAAEPASRVAALLEAVVAEVAPEAVPSPEAEQSRLQAQAKRARSRRSLAFHSDGDGAVTFRGSLPDADAAGFVRMIEALVESDRRAGRDRASDRLDPLAESRTPDQRRADALLMLVRQALNAGSVPRVAGDRPRVVVTMREADLRERAEQAGVLSSGQQISAGDLRRLCCDADLLPVVLGADSEVLDVGRTQRLGDDGDPAGAERARRRVHLPAVHRPRQPVRRTPHRPLVGRGRDRALKPGDPLPSPPRPRGAAPLLERAAARPMGVRLNGTGLPEFLPPLRQDRLRTPLPGNRPPPGLVA